MDFIAATHVDEALDAMADLDDPRPLAGGTDLMVGVNLAHDRPTSVVSVRRIDDLADMDPRRIGSGVTWERLEHLSLIHISEPTRLKTRSRMPSSA